MNYYDNGFIKKRPVRRTQFWKGMILGLLVGCIMMTTTFFYQACGMPAQENDAAGTIPMPEQDQNDTGQIMDVPPEVESYYMAVVNAAEQVMPSVVGISNFAVITDSLGRSNLQERGTGSGVIIDENGYIVTNYHVIENARELIVTLGSGDELAATVVGTDPPTDLAVLKIEREGLPAAEFADSDMLRVGEPAIAIGNPLGLDFQQTVTLGVLSARERSITIQGQFFLFLQTDAAINEGNSGGALVNIYGQVMGINTAKILFPGVEGMGFAIPSNTVKEITQELITRGRVERPWLGVYLSTLTPLDAERFSLQVEAGVLIRDVIAGSPADTAGIMPLDVVVAINGNNIDDSGQLQEILLNADVRQTMDITLIRGQEELTITVTLRAMPDQLD